MKSVARWFMVALMVFALAMAGCDDGDNGSDGASAYEIAGGDAVWGSEEAWLDSLRQPSSTVTPVESCNLCHDPGSFADAEVAHIVTGETSYTVESAPALVVDEVVMTFAIAVDGVPFNDFTTVQRAVIFNGVDGEYTQYDFRNIPDDPDTVEDEAVTYVTLDAVVDGLYTLRLSGTKNFGTAEAPVLVDATSFSGGDTRYYFRLQTATGVTPTLRASVSADDPAYVRLDLASDQACINCHGDYIGSGSSHHYNPFQVSNCVACHGAENAPFLDLPSLIHGIHNSHNMPSGHFEFGGEEWSVTYPTYMNNCSVCHDSEETLAAVNAMPVSGPGCFSCHGDMTSFPFTSATALSFQAYHLALPVSADCQACHVADGAAPNKVDVADFHNGQTTGRSGVIWDGQDVSVVEGAKVDMQITGVTRDGDNLAVTWTATYDGAVVDPCNTTVAVNAPIFHAGGAADATTGQANSNFSILRAYAQGDDFINPDIGVAPGQPVATNLDTTNTVCEVNVATTTIALSTAELATTATKGVVALQGKSQVDLGFDYNLSTAGIQSVDQVRSKTPTREFLVATGALPADQRRLIADSEACLKCHVGSLYQHGGNRVDNVDLCVMCHNEASSEQNVRALDGVDASEAYDGQVGQTYGFKSLLHAIHSTGSDVNSSKITMIYRTNGVYVWAPEGVTPPNWPGTGPQLVYGSSAPHGTGPNGEVQRTHNLHSPTYPRFLNDCSACHVDGFTIVPEQAISMATTTNAGQVDFNPGAGFGGTGNPSGSGTVAVNGNQLDDTLVGSGTAACTSCHQALKPHAYQNSWAPSVFEDGRQTIIDNAF